MCGLIKRPFDETAGLKDDWGKLNAGDRHVTAHDQLPFLYINNAKLYSEAAISHQPVRHGFKHFLALVSLLLLFFFFL